MTSPARFRRICSALAFSWLLASVSMLVYGCVRLSYDPTFRLGVGLLQIRGFIGLLIAIPMALAGIVATILLWRRRKLGAQLLIVYCSFWTISLVAGVVADYIRHPSKVLVYSPVGTIVFLVLLISFLSVTVWAWHRLMLPTPQTLSHSA